MIDALHASGLIRQTGLLRVYGRWKRIDREIRAGTYRFQPGTGWRRILDDLTAGRVTTEAVTIPEGFTLDQIAPRIAAVTGDAPERVAALLADSLDATDWEVPGPGLEGYLFPDTYRFAPGVPLGTVVSSLTGRYRSVWSDAWRARLDSLGMSEGEVVTLASIIQAEARVASEMPIISAVYHNRLRRGMPLQADPTVLYALGGHRPRLLYAAMDSVANHPYNTYTRSGLPPGPIGAPGEAAIRAALFPADTTVLFFVARVDGSHVFSRTLAEHNRAVAEYRRERAAAERAARRSEPPAGASPDERR